MEFEQIKGWSQDLENYFYSEDIKEKWRKAFEDIQNIAYVLPHAQGEFFLNKKNNLLFIRTTSRFPVSPLNNNNYALIYKNQVISFRSITSKFRDTALVIKYFPESLKDEHYIVIDEIKKFVIWFSENCYPVTFKTK